jgi:hypothetical protein
MGRTQTYGWTKGSSMAEFQLRMIRVLDELQHRQTTNTSRKFIRSSVPTAFLTEQRKVAEECDISMGSCHNILTEKLGMHRVAAKFVPRLLTDKQKEQSVAISQGLWVRC